MGIPGIPQDSIFEPLVFPSHTFSLSFFQNPDFLLFSQFYPDVAECWTSMAKSSAKENVLSKRWWGGRLYISYFLLLFQNHPVY